MGSLVLLPVRQQVLTEEWLLLTTSRLGDPRGLAREAQIPSAVQRSRRVAGPGGRRARGLLHGTERLIKSTLLSTPILTPGETLGLCGTSLVG